MNRLREALQRVGGPCSVTWFAFWTLLLLNFTHHLVGSPGVHGHGVVRFGAVILSQLAMFAVLLAGRVTVLRHVDRNPRPVATLLVFMASGATRSVTLWAVIARVTAVPRPLIIGSVITGALVFTTYLSLCSYLMDVYRANKRQMQKALRARNALVAARAASTRGLGAQNEEMVASLQAEVLGQLDSLAGDSHALTAKDLRTFLDDTVRPTSHRLAAGIPRWQAPDDFEPRPRSRRLFDAVGVARPFAPVLQGAMSLLPVFSIAAGVGRPRFLVMLVVGFGAPWLMLTLGNLLVGRLPGQSSARVRITVVLGWCVVAALAVATVWGACLAGTWLGRTAFQYGSFFTLVVALASIAVKAALTAQRRSVHELHDTQEELRWDVTRVRQLQWHQQRLSARALHGPVQSAIILETMRLGDDSESVDEFRARLTDALNAALIDSGQTPSLREMVASLAVTWTSLCTLTASLSPDSEGVDGDPVSRSCLADLLREAVANAVRHGGATRVSLDIHCQAPRVLAVTVCDNGSHRETTEGSGLGSQILDDCCMQWERTHDMVSTELRFSLPFDPDYSEAVAASSPGVGHASEVTA